MFCPYLQEVVQYLMIGAAYAGVKHYALWEYYRERSFLAKFHHYWFEACFWPLDLLLNTAKILARNYKG